MKSHVDQEIHIGAVIRNAVVFKPETSRGDALDAETLVETVARLFALLQERKIEYVLVGGVAMLQYVAGRNTEDIDLIMAVSSLKELPEIQTSSQDADFARGKFEGLQINLLLTSNPPFRVRQAVSHGCQEIRRGGDTLRYCRGVNPAKDVRASFAQPSG